MNIEKLKTINSTNPVVANAIAAIVKNEGTSEGAKKGWETRQGGAPSIDRETKDAEQALGLGSYEDPKTARMKAKLAKMQERNAALRADIEKRKAHVAEMKKALGVNASGEWKLHSTNPVVESALAYAANKACANQDQAPEDPAVVENYGTSEGARKAAETRKRGGGAAMQEHDAYSDQLMAAARTRGVGARAGRMYDAYAKAHPDVAGSEKWKMLGDYLRSRKLIK